MEAAESAEAAQKVLAKYPMEGLRKTLEAFLKQAFSALGPPFLQVRIQPETDGVWPIFQDRELLFGKLPGQVRFLLAREAECGATEVYLDRFWSQIARRGGRSCAYAW